MKFLTEYTNNLSLEKINNTIFHGQPERMFKADLISIKSNDKWLGMYYNGNFYDDGRSLNDTHQIILDIYHNGTLLDLEKQCDKMLK